MQLIKKQYGICTIFFFVTLLLTGAVYGVDKTLLELAQEGDSSFSPLSIEASKEKLQDPSVTGEDEEHKGDIGQIPEKEFPLTQKDSCLSLGEKPPILVTETLTSKTNMASTLGVVSFPDMPSEMENLINVPQIVPFLPSSSQILEEPTPKKGKLSYRAEIDLDAISFSHLTRLISSHYELGIPLAFDFEHVNKCFGEDLKKRLQYIHTPTKERFNGKRLRILSIDGGGVRGIIPTRILAELESRTGLPISQLFDIIVASSTGAIIAAGLTYPAKDNPSKPAYSAQDILKLYIEQSSTIFSQKLQYSLIGMWGGKYSADPLMKIFKEKFGDSTLRELICDTLFTAYSLSDRTGHVFSTGEAQINHKKNYFINDVLRASTAAPTIFNPHQIGKKILCDGGLFLNNPVMLAILRGMEKYGKLPHEMEIVSLGTGCSIDVQTLTGYEGYSKLGWVDEMLNAFLDGESQHSIAQTMTRAEGRIHGLGNEKNYRRFTVDLPKELLEIDNYSQKNLKALLEIAENKIKLCDNDINSLCERLKTNL